MNTTDFQADDALNLEKLAERMEEEAVRQGFGLDLGTHVTETLRQIAGKIRREWTTPGNRETFTDEEVARLRASVRNLQETALPLVGRDDVSQNERDDAKLKLHFADAVARVADVIERRLRSG